GVTTVTTPRRIPARIALDCSGRAGAIARRGWRRTSTAYRTLAVVAEWECARWPDEERTRTLVESYADGWAWSVPLSPTRRQCTVMVEGGSRRSPEKLALQRLALQRTRAAAAQSSSKEREPFRRAARERYAYELAMTSELRSRLAHAKQIGAPWACDASIYDCAQAASGCVLLVGDAASFIEPLSSAGVKKALLSAWRAAVVANTCMKDSSLAAAALDLFNRRERQVYAECLRRSTAFFREAAAAYGSPFWEVRAKHEDAVDAPVPGGDGDWTDDALAHDAGVRDAF